MKPRLACSGADGGKPTSVPLLPSPSQDNIIDAAAPKAHIPSLASASFDHLYGMILLPGELSYPKCRKEITEIFPQTEFRYSVPLIQRQTDPHLAMRAG